MCVFSFFLLESYYRSSGTTLWMKSPKSPQNNGTFEKTSGADEGRVTQSKASELQLHLDLE